MANHSGRFYCLMCQEDHQGISCDELQRRRKEAAIAYKAVADASDPRKGLEPAYNGQAAAPQDGSKVQGYRKLSPAEIEAMNSFKETSRYFLASLQQQRETITAQINGPARMSTLQRAEAEAALRWLAVAKTDMQRACMAACRAIARPEDDC